MKLCMMSCMMGRFTPEQIVATATACGMEAIDWVSTHHTEPAELRKISEDAGLRIAAHTMIKNFSGGRRIIWMSSRLLWMTPVFLGRRF